MRRAEPLAGLGGILLLVSLFLPWYGEQQAPQNLTVSGGFDPSAWQAFTVIDIVLALLALVAIAVPIVSALSEGPAKPVAIEVIGSAFGWVAVVLVLWRIVDAPADGLDPRFGIWLGLAGAVIAWVGSWLSLSDESVPGAVAPSVPVRPAP
jgi:hypothetical protein